MQPIVLDMPAGIYVVDGGASVACSDSVIYGGGTAWTTRLCSRIIANGTSSTVSASSSGLDEYSTLTQALSKMGQVVQEVDKVLHTSNTPEKVSVYDPSGERTIDINTYDLTPIDKGMTKDDWRAYFDFFRSEGAVNVPYVRDGYWFVNGRRITKVFESTPEFMESVGSTFTESVVEYIKTNTKEFRGEDGAKGDPGYVWVPIVSVEEDGAKVSIKWELRDLDGSVVNLPGITPPTSIELKALKGEDGKDGKDGDKGDQGDPGGYWYPEVKDGKLTWKWVGDGSPTAPSSVDLNVDTATKNELTDAKKALEEAAKREDEYEKKLNNLHCRLIDVDKFHKTQLDARIENIFNKYLGQMGFVTQK